MPATSGIVRRDDTATSLVQALSSLLGLSLRMLPGAHAGSRLRGAEREQLSLAHTAMWLVLRSCATQATDTRRFFPSLRLLPPRTAFNLRADVQLVEQRGWFVLTAITAAHGADSLREALDADALVAAHDPASALRGSLLACGLPVLAAWMGSPEAILELSRLLARLLSELRLVRGAGSSGHGEEQLRPYLRNAHKLLARAAPQRERDSDD